MAQPPSFPKLTGDYERDVHVLRDALQAVTQCLSGGIELGRNCRAKVFTLDFVAPVVKDITLATNYTSAPAAVLLAGFWKVTGGLEPRGLGSSFSWKFDKGNIVTPTFTGITGTDTYRVSLLAWES